MTRTTGSPTSIEGVRGAAEKTLARLNDFDVEHVSLSDIDVDIHRSIYTFPYYDKTLLSK